MSLGFFRENSGHTFGQSQTSHDFDNTNQNKIPFRSEHKAPEYKPSNSDTQNHLKDITDDETIKCTVNTLKSEQPFYNSENNNFIHQNSQKLSVKSQTSTNGFERGAVDPLREDQNSQKCIEKMTSKNEETTRQNEDIEQQADEKENSFQYSERIHSEDNDSRNTTQDSKQNLYSKKETSLNINQSNKHNNKQNTSMNIEKNDEQGTDKKRTAHISNSSQIGALETQHENDTGLVEGYELKQSDKTLENTNNDMKKGISDQFKTKLDGWETQEDKKNKSKKETRRIISNLDTNQDNDKETSSEITKETQNIGKSVSKKQKTHEYSLNRKYAQIKYKEEIHALEKYKSTQDPIHRGLENTQNILQAEKEDIHNSGEDTNEDNSKQDSYGKNPNCNSGSDFDRNFDLSLSNNDQKRHTEKDEEGFFFQKDISIPKRPEEDLKNTNHSTNNQKFDVKEEDALLFWNFIQSIHQKEQYPQPEQFNSQLNNQRNKDIQTSPSFQKENIYNTTQHVKLSHQSYYNRRSSYDTINEIQKQRRGNSFIIHDPSNHYFSNEHAQLSNLNRIESDRHISRKHTKTLYNEETASKNIYYPIHEYHDSDIYKCSWCDSCYIYRKSFINHLMKVHSYTKVEAMKYLGQQTQP